MASPPESKKVRQKVSVVAYSVAMLMGYSRPAMGGFNNINSSALAIHSYLPLKLHQRKLSLGKNPSGLPVWYTIGGYPFILEFLI